MKIKVVPGRENKAEGRGGKKEKAPASKGGVRRVGEGIAGLKIHLNTSEHLPSESGLIRILPEANRGRKTIKKKPPQLHLYCRL